MQELRAADPRRIGPYEVLGRLGAGGMGEVYLAESRGGLRLAVKVVRAEHAEDRTFRARFRQEVRAAQTVGGAGTYTARVADADTAAERPWMATEFVDGPNLRDAVLDGGALPRPAVLVLAGALGEALAAIHAKGLVHRDLKPSNILLGPDGPRVIDFGIVRALEATALTRTGAVVGSVGYVSPEQIRNGGQVGPPSDVFSLGAVLAYAAAGREPFGEGQDSVILLRILTRDFDLSGVPEDVRPLVEACLREDPLERPTPAEVLAATGHTTGSLRAGVRPGWYTAASARPERREAAGRWIPEQGAAERESRVEYAAPVITADAAAESGPGPAVPGAAPPASGAAPTVTGSRPTGPVAPGRRRLLRLAAGGVLAFVGAGVGEWLWKHGTGTEAESGSGSTGAGGTNAKGADGPAAVRWQYDVGGLGGLEGPCAALSPDGAVVYVGGANGTLHAVSRTGARRWKVKLGDEVSTPVVTRDGVFCVTWDHDRSLRRLRAVAFDGSPKWKQTLGDHGYGIPVPIGDDVLVVMGDTDAGGLRRVAADGSERWLVTTPAGPSGTPLVAGGVVYTGSYGDRLVALDAADGAKKWSVAAGADAAVAALLGSTLVAFDGRGRTGLRAQDGRRLWRTENSSAATLTRGNRSLLIGTEQGSVYAVRAADGGTAWTRGVTGASGPYATVSGDTVYARVGQRVWAIGLDGTERWSAALGQAYGDDQHTPVARAGRLYVPSGTGIAAVDVTG